MHKLAIAFTVANLAMCGACVWYVRASEEHVLTTVDKLRSVEIRTMKTQWNSGGVRREVITARNQGESSTDWLARHMQEVADAQAQFPPD